MTTESQPKKKTSIGKIILYVFLGIIALGVLGSIVGDDEAATQTATAATPSTNLEEPESVADQTEEWIEVLSIEGNGSKKSKTFHLTGNDAKLVYTYKSEMDDMGVFGIYVTDKGEDVMETGGFPEVMLQKSAIKEEESALQKSEGDYYLNINAAGDWTIKVLEKNK